MTSIKGKQPQLARHGFWLLHGKQQPWPLCCLITTNPLSKLISIQGTRSKYSFSALSESYIGGKSFSGNGCILCINIYIYMYTHIKTINMLKKRTKIGFSDLPRNEGRRLSKETWKTGIQTGQRNSKKLMYSPWRCASAFGVEFHQQKKTDQIKRYCIWLIIYIYIYIQRDYITTLNGLDSIFFLPNICRFPAFVPSPSSPKLVMDLPTIILCLYPRGHECVYGSI